MKKLLAFLILVTMLGCGKEAEQEKIEEKKDTVSNIELEKEKVEVKQKRKKKKFQQFHLERKV